MLKQAVFFVLLALAVNSGIVPQVPRILWKARNGFIFFICVGMLGHAFIRWRGQLQTALDFSVLNLPVAIAIPIFIIPLLSIAFIHPLVLFIIFNPLLSPYLQGTGVGELSLYCVWVVMLINAQLLSPVSLTTVLSVSSSKTNIFTESFLKHSLDALNISTIAYLYLLLFQYAG